MRFSLIFGVLVLSSLGYSQILNNGIPDSFQMGYATYLKNGDSSLVLSNSGASSLGPGTGNLCVNTYVFDTREEMNECCACTVTPDGFRSFSAKTDLTSNPLTGIAPTNIIIKLVATAETAGPCDPASVTAAQLAPGMTAWGTTLTPAPPAGKTYVAIAEDYKDEELSAGELASLTSTCGFIFRLGSGSGICKCGVSGD
ncbi:MAG: hypothetical protein WB566_19160 [Terriglobales bacterium]